MRKFIIISVLVASVLGVGGVGYSRGWFWQAKMDESNVETATAMVKKMDVDFSIDVSGDVAPQFQLDVKPEVGGKVKKLHVQAGDKVEQGQILVEIDDRDILTERESARTEIEGAKVQVEKVSKNFERAKELFEQKLISIEAYDNLESELALARNSLERADRRLQLVEDKLQKTKVIAPSDGTVLTVPVIQGQVAIAAASVNSGTTLMTIANLERLLVECHVNQVDVARITPGQSVSLRSESLKDAKLVANIFFIAPVATVKSGVKGFTIQALIDDAPAALRPGMTINMGIPIARANDALAVPISAVFRGDGGKRVVFVRSGQNTEKREVKIGVSNIEHAQVLTGLNEGEMILLVNPERQARKRS